MGVGFDYCLLAGVDRFGVDAEFLDVRRSRKVSVVIPQGHRHRVPPAEWNLGGW